MKKILLLALIAAAMVGCAQNEEMENAAKKAEVQIGTVVRNSTRAAVTDLDALKVADAGFYVYAYNTTTYDAGAPEAKLTSIFVDKAKVTYVTDAWVIGTGEPIYWPGTNKIQFFAYAPTADANVTYSVPTDALYPTIGYTVPTTATDQKDFVVASALDKSISQTAVTLSFSHALTQINFTAKGKDNLTYEISKISLVGIGKTATYDYKTGWGAVTGSAEYELPIVTTTIDGTTEKQLTATSGSLMLIPQTMTTDTKIKISYVVKNGDTEVYKKDDALIELDGTATWESGKRIRYTLTLSHEIALSFAPDVTDWNKDSETNVPK